MKKIFNLETIVSIEVSDREVCKSVSFRPKGRGNGMFSRNIIPEGFYSWNNNYVTSEEILSGEFLEKMESPIVPPISGYKLLIDRDVVYHPPYVRLRFADQQELVRTFKSHVDAMEYAKEMADAGINVQLDLQSEKITRKN